MNVNLKPRVVNKFKVGDENMLFCFFLETYSKKCLPLRLTKNRGCKCIKYLGDLTKTNSI